MTCPKCHLENDPASQFCGHCGAPLSPGAPPPPGMRAAPAPGMPGMRVPPPAGPPTPGLAIVSLVFAILGLCCLLPVIGGIVGLICGIVALGKIKGSNGELGGQGVAIGGIIISSIGLAFSVVILPAVLFPVFSQARDQARKTTCMANVKQLNLGLMMYVQDFDEVSPPAAKWSDAIFGYIKAPLIFNCPAHSTTLPGYALNRQVDRISMASVAMPSAVPTLFDAQVSALNALGGQESIDRRHMQGYIMGYMDGHARWLAPSRPNLQADTWNPRAAPGF